VERWDNGEAERRRWTEWPAWRSSDVSVREWRRTGQGASVEYGSADGARDCGCGAAKVANDSEQDCGGVVATEVERRRNRGSEMWPCERVKVVEEGSWMLCGTKKQTDELEQLLASGGATWRGGRKPAEVGRAAGG
jgi:hypothetical protein